MWSLSFYKTFCFCENLHLNYKCFFYPYTFPYSTHTVLMLFLQVLKSLKSGNKNPADTLVAIKNLFYSIVCNLSKCNNLLFL